MSRELRLRDRFTRWAPGEPGAVTRRVREGVFAHALDEDVALRLLPLPRQTRFTVTTSPESQEARNFVREALGWEARRSRDDLEHAAWEFFRECAHNLTQYGEVVWEVCPCDPEGIALVFVQPDTLRRRWFRTTQVAVGEDGRSCTIVVPDDRLVRVRTRETGQLHRARNHLAGPGFAHAALSALITRDLKFPVSVAEISKNEDLALAQVGLLCDWDGRTFFARRVSEFYLLLRVLRFRRFLAQVREQVIAGINAALARGRAPIRLTISGLLTTEELSLLERDLVSGQRPLRAVREVLLGRGSE
jgi:hypothetical protein